MKRVSNLIVVCAALLGAACGNTAAPPVGEQAAPTTGNAPAASGEKTVLSVWTYLAADDAVVAAYEREFEAKHPNIDIEHTAIPEDDYIVKLETALAAKDVPDVAFIENQSWMKAGAVVDLTEPMKTWGVAPSDFNPGGLARLTWDVNQGIYGVGDFLGGNVIFYNKALFDQAGIAYPDANKSLTTAEFASLCTQLAKPNPDPAQAIWGCSMPEWGLRINAAWVFGKDGRVAEGNLNSAAMKEAYKLATKLDADGIAAGSAVVGDGSGGGALGSESDLFAQGKLAMTWSDFTEAAKYKENGIEFGIMPFFVPEGAGPFVDVWTAPWGTFNDAKHKPEALEFLRFIATDAQYLRPTISSDPPLSTKVANEINWGKGDPVSEQYLQALSIAPGQPFVPPVPEGTIPWRDVWAQMLENPEADVSLLLDDLAAQSQTALDQAWTDWEALGK